LHPGLTLVQPVTGFQVASVHSIDVFALFAEHRGGAVAARGGAVLAVLSEKSKIRS
jgi:hypothetical protein